MYKNKNIVNLVGICKSLPQVCHTGKDGIVIYEFDISIKRKTGYQDIISIHTRKELDIVPGDKVEIFGCVRSRNNEGRLNNFVFSDVIEKTNKDELNICEYEGFVGTDIEYKNLSKGRTLSNFLLASNELSRSHYLSVLCWGLKAEWVKYMKKGTHLKLVGRLQSRDFTQKDGSERRVLELSVQELEVIYDEDSQGNESKD